MKLGLILKKFLNSNYSKEKIEKEYDEPRVDKWYEEQKAEMIIKQNSILAKERSELKLNTNKVDIKFRQMTDKEILQLKKLNISAMIYEISENGNVFKDGKVTCLSIRETREIAEQFSEKWLDRLNKIKFTIDKIEINDNKLNFLVNDWIFHQNFGISFDEWEKINNKDN